MTGLTPESLYQQSRLGKRARTESNAREPQDVRASTPEQRTDHIGPDEHSEQDEEQRAHQAFRKRTTDYIANLEEQLASQARTSSRKIAKLTSEIQTLRHRRQALQRRLDSIGQLAKGIDGEDGMNSTLENHDRHEGYRNPEDRDDSIHSYHGDNNVSNISHILNSPDINGSHQERATVGAAGQDDAISGQNLTNQTQQLPSPAATHNPITSPMTTTANPVSDSNTIFSNFVQPLNHDATPPDQATLHPRHSTASQQSPPSLVQNSQHSPIGPSSHSRHSSNARRESELEQLPQFTYSEPNSVQTPTPASSIRPQHVAPTCPLDRILLNLLESRIDMLSEGTSIDTVLGPVKGIVTGFLDKKRAANVHPISRIISEILSTFPNIALPERMGMFYKMHLMLRWQISPTPENYDRMPIWLRPTVTQITVPHTAWIDNIPWPGVRDLLISRPDDYLFEDFSEYYSQNMTVNWHFDNDDALAHVGGNVVLHSIFEKHVSKLENWTVSEGFQARFPEMSRIIFGRDAGT